MDEPVIIVDNREQNPFENMGATRVARLKTGDYSLDGFQDAIAIEHKDDISFWVK
ncbi:MAG: hypothetical protein M1511_05905 [Deltaproteobacteria bacterium]|nr:hypothetical protein [Deltaproteobacteria bacterium]